MLTDLGEKYTRKFNLLYLMKCSLCVISLGINIKQNFDCFSIISINSKKQIGFIFSTQKWSLSKLHWSELHEIWFKIQYLSTVSWLLLISFGSQFWNCWIENTVRIVISSINFGTIPYILINSKQVFHMKKNRLVLEKSPFNSPSIIHVGMFYSFYLKAVLNDSLPEPALPEERSKASTSTDSSPC